MAGVKGMHDKLSTSPAYAEKVRARIKAGGIVHRLQKHVLGEIQMSPSQVAAGLGLLRKVVADVSHVEHSGDVNVNTFAVPLTQAMEESPEWERRTVQ